MMNNDNSLICFKAISNFTNELAELYSKQQRSLKLYNRLINKTTLTHDVSIRKHIDAFRIFCVANRDAITSKQIDKVLECKISYSERVFIDIVNIFKIADGDTKKVIWEHLLCISALVDPAGKAKEILKENLAMGKNSTGETNFLTEIIDKVEKHVDPNANPMEAVSSIMKSGIFTELIGGMNQGLSDGSLDISKLMSAVQGMVSQLGEKTGNDSQTDGQMQMLSAMMSGIGGMGGENNSMPDMASMMQGMFSNLGSMSISSDVEQKKLQ
jgi:hypothetical protein